MKYFHSIATGLVLLSATACYTNAAAGPIPFIEYSQGQVWMRDLNKESLHAFNRYFYRQTDWQEVFAVTMDNGCSVQGEYTVFENAVSFTPRFSFSRGTQYTATFHLNELTQNFNEIYLPKLISEPVVFTFVVQENKETRAEVLAVYPSADVIPENQLKFHVVFNSSMSAGEIYKRIKLTDETGKIVENAFNGKLNLSIEL